MTKRAAIYARVSSDAQREKHTIENQLRSLPAFIEAQGWKLVETYVDDGRSARTGKLEAREGFAQLLRDAARDRFDMIVVVDIDRLTRTEDMRERAEILGPFQRLGIDIATPGMGVLDLRTMLGELYVMIQAVVAAEENRKRAERIKLGKARAIAEGRKPAGPTPFGLRYDRKTATFTLHEGEAAAIREIVSRVLAGESVISIAESFALRDDIASPRGGWGRDAIYRIVDGTWICGEWIVDKKRGLGIKVPLIVPRETMLEVKQALQKRQRSSVGRTKHTYLLQDIATCGACGAPIHIRAAVEYFNAARESRVHEAKYVCSARKLRRACLQKASPISEIDERVWKRLSDEIAKPEIIQALAAAGQRRQDDATDWRGDVDRYRAHIERLDKVEAAIMVRFRRGTITEAALDDELEALGRERKTVRGQLAVAERAAGVNESVKDRLRSAASMIDRLRAALPNATPEQRQALLRELAVDATILDGRVHLDLRLVRPETQKAAQPPMEVVRRTAYSEPNGAELKIRLVA